MGLSELQVYLDELGKIFQQSVPIEIASQVPTVLNSFSTSEDRDKSTQELEFAAKKASKKNSAESVVNSMVSVADSSTGAYFASAYVTGPASDALRNSGFSDDGSDAAKYIRVLHTSQITPSGGLSKNKHVFQIPGMPLPPGVEDMLTNELDKATHINKSPTLPKAWVAPSIAIFLIPHADVTFSKNTADIAEIFVNHIPTVERSRCVPYVRMNIMPLFDSSVIKSEFGLTDFLAFGDSETDKIGLGQSERMNVDVDGESVSSMGISALDSYQSGGSQALVQAFHVLTADKDKCLSI